MKKREDFVWVEKHRPKTIDECILPKQMKDIFKGILKNEKIPNLLLCGKPGVGKTTVAKALCNELSVDHIFINGSEQSGIDTLRTTIKDFASTVSVFGNRKVVIIDEADYLTGHTQAALRSFIEEFSKNCTFIFTCNFKNKIKEAIHSRCSVIEFVIKKEDRMGLIEEFYKRVVSILKIEGVKFNREVVGRMILNNFPDFRRTLNELQKFSQINDEIDESVLAQIHDINIDVLYKALKGKKYGELRKWVVESLDNDQNQIYREIYDSLVDNLEAESVPMAVLIIADYQYKSAFVADPEINLLACLTELLRDCEFK